MTINFIYTIFRYTKDDEKSSKFNTVYSNQLYAEENPEYYYEKVLERISDLEDFHINGEVSINKDFAFLYRECLNTGEVIKITAYTLLESLETARKEIEEDIGHMNDEIIISNRA